MFVCDGRQRFSTNGTNNSLSEFSCSCVTTKVSGSDLSVKILESVGLLLNKYLWFGGMITQEAHILPFLPSKRVQLLLSIGDSLFQIQRAVDKSDYFWFLSKCFTSTMISQFDQNISLPRASSLQREEPQLGLQHFFRHQRRRCVALRAQILQGLGRNKSYTGWFFLLVPPRKVLSMELVPPNRKKWLSTLVPRKTQKITEFLTNNFS